MICAQGTGRVSCWTTWNPSVGFTFGERRRSEEHPTNLASACQRQSYLATRKSLLF